MKKKINQALPEGVAQPEIRPGDIWRDKSGRQVSVTGYAFNRVTYVRVGYERPCIFPADRFHREFSRVSVQTFSEWKAAAEPLEKARKLRELITRSRGKAL